MNYRSDLGLRKIRIFFRKGLDRRTGNAQSASLICPSGHQPCRLKQRRPSRSSSALAAEVAVTNPDVGFILANGLQAALFSNAAAAFSASYGNIHAAADIHSLIFSARSEALSLADR